MALFSRRMKQINPNNNIIDHFIKRHYFQISSPRFISPSQTLPYNNNFISSYNTSKIRPTIYQPPQKIFNTRVRFFAAPVQVKKKEEVIHPGKPRLNEEIKAEFLRLVSDEGHTVVSRHEALRRAKSEKLDLVEVDRLAKPPVCKIMDYNREKYKKQVREKERSKIKSAGSLKKGACKEVRFSAKTELKDLKMKADTVKRMMERGYRVKCTATGSEDQDLSGLLSQLSALIEDVALVELGPKMEKKQAHLIVRHIKFGPSKKGANKPSKDKTDASSAIHNDNDDTACSDSPADLGEKSDYEKSGLDDDDEVEEPLPGQKESAWSVTSVSRADKTIDKMFDASHDVNGTISSHDKQVRFDREAVASTATNNASRLSAPSVPSSSGPNVRAVSQESENRYARTAANNTSAVRTPTRFPNNGTQPQPQPQPQPHPRVPPPIGPRQGGREAPPLRNFRLPPEEIPLPQGKILNQSLNQSSQPNSNAGSPKSPSTGFGIFSSTKIDANESNSASPSITRNSGPRMAPGNLKPPTSKSDDPQKSESADKKWGIFSK